MSRTWRRFRMGMLTLSGLAKQGYFIPYRYAAQTAVTADNAFTGVADLCDQAMPVFRNWIDRLNANAGDLSAIGDSPPPAPRWRQDWFPGLDGAMAYTIVRGEQPERIVEIGCGHSTRFFARAVGDGGLGTSITAIDPAPRADLEGVGVRFIQATVQQAMERPDGQQCFRELRPGDVLSIDSSHILMPGTDVDILLNRVLPTLPSGVLVHIHDMFLPDDYPKSWSWRGYNEQLGVATLLGGAGYALLWSSHFVRTRMQDALSKGTFTQDMHVPDGACESSLWLRKV